MPRFESTSEQCFYRHFVPVGESFEASRRDGEFLRALGRAKPYEAAVATAEPAAATPRRTRNQRDPSKPKRQYRRRDMQAGA